MGKLILCSGTRTKRPYIFNDTGSRIYSIEELCYYISSNIYFIEKGIFTDSLIDWIENELSLKVCAEKLGLLKASKDGMKTMVTVVLCSADYFTEKEIKGLLNTLDRISALSPIQKNCLRAKSYLYNRQYREACIEYERIINTKDLGSITPEEYGDILHNMGVVKAHISGLSEAIELFCHAYERNHREESLMQYMYAILLTGNRSLFEDKAKEYGLDGNTCSSLTNRVDELLRETDQIEEMGKIERMKELRAQGRLADYNRMTSELINTWITQYRRGSKDGYLEAVSQRE